MTRAGAKTFVFEKKLNGRTVRSRIGDVGSWTLNSVWEGKGDGRREVQRGAREEANRVEALVDQGIDPREKAREQRNADKARRAALAAEAEAKQYTLEKLMAVYVAHLANRVNERGGVENCVANHVTKAHPEIAQQACQEGYVARRSRDPAAADRGGQGPHGR